jgi:nucleoside-diphosphate-sugar epimerase
MNSSNIISSADRILVTGSNGFIGAKVVEILLEYGFANVRCFVRPSSKLDRLKKTLEKYPAGKTAEIISGDLLSRDDCQKAAAGVAVIYHLAAGMEKSFAGAFMNSALATRNLIEAFVAQASVVAQASLPAGSGGVPPPERRTPVRLDTVDGSIGPNGNSALRGRFVNVSSFAVYSNLKMARGALLDETCPLEDVPQARHDAYCFGKLKQEQLVRQYGETHKLPYVILRPGAVFGPGKKSLSGRVGIDTFGFFIHLGGSNELPLTFVDNCAEAIVLAGLKPGVDGEVFNVVDDEPLTSEEFLRAYKGRVKPFLSVRVPFFVADIMCRLWENFSTRRHGQLPPVFNRRRAAAEWKGNRYANQKLHDRLGWKPRVNMDQAMAAFLAQYENPQL